jgi:hypothetical protein
MASQRAAQQKQRVESLQAWQHFNKNQSYGQDIVGEW